jgi:hypothetical protein
MMSLPVCTAARIIMMLPHWHAAPGRRLGLGRAAAAAGLAVTVRCQSLCLALAVTVATVTVTVTVTARGPGGNLKRAVGDSVSAAACRSLAA